MIYTPREGGIEHVGIDMQDNVRDFIADWVAECLVPASGDTST